MKHRIGAGRAAAGQTARRWTSRLLASPALRWRYGAAVADHLLVQPQDLRAVDEAVASELAEGWLRLDGTAIDVRGDQPFDQPRLSIAERAQLDGFGWLRHLKAVGTGRAQADARRLMRAWLGADRGSAVRRRAEQPGVLARRMLSWLSVADFIATGADDDTLDLVLDNFAEARVKLAAHWRSAPAGRQRLLAVIALALYDTVIDSRDAERERSLARLATELNLQTAADGGAVSRNGCDTIDMLYDLLALHYAMVTRGLPADDRLLGAIDAGAAVLRHTTLGDGTLARFNGVGRLSWQETRLRGSGLATPGVAPDGAAAPKPVDPIRAGYARLERGGTVVVMDVAPPPSLDVATAAGAGCLAFEVSIGRQRLLGNAYAPRTLDGAREAGWRATAAHATLALAGQSSGNLVDMAAGGHTSAALHGPGAVRITARPEPAADAVIVAAHDGYAGRHGLQHTRRLQLNEAGDALAGVDTLAAPSGTVRLKQDVPFAVYFHVEPGVELAHLPADRAVDLSWAANGQPVTWRFTIERGAVLSLEASPGGERGQIAIVLRGATFGETGVAWSLTHHAPAGEPEAAAPDAVSTPEAEKATSSHG